MEILKKALFYRAFENEVAALFDRGLVPGFVHLSNGAELLHAALAENLILSTDYVTASHRGHTVALAAGADPLAVMGEILGRQCGLSHGFAGTQHLCDSDTGSAFLVSTGIVGSQAPIAAGAALKIKREGRSGVAVTVMGDGAFNQGAVLETLNLASVQRLPLLFILENNGVAQTTPSIDVVAGSLVERARGFKIAASRADVMESHVMQRELDHMMRWCRSGSGPAFLEVRVPRLSGHYYNADREYMGSLERSDDPLGRYMDVLRLKGKPDSDIERAIADAQEKVLAIAKSAMESPEADTEVLDNFASQFEVWQ